MSEDVFAMALADNDVKFTVSDDALTAVSQLATRQVQLENEIAMLEERVAEKKKALQRVAEHDLPEAMDKINMSKFDLKGGVSIKVASFYTASIPADRKPEAYQWLEDKGHGGLIKTEVSLSYGKGELEIAREFIEWLNKVRPELHPDLEQSIHWQTLRAFVKEQVESGAALPIDLLGIYVGRRAKVTIPKAK